MKASSFSNTVQQKTWHRVHFSPKSHQGITTPEEEEEEEEERGATSLGADNEMRTEQQTARMNAEKYTPEDVAAGRGRDFCSRKTQSHRRLIVEGQTYRRRQGSNYSLSRLWTSNKWTCL